MRHPGRRPGRRRPGELSTNGAAETVAGTREADCTVDTPKTSAEGTVGRPGAPTLRPAEQHRQGAVRGRIVVASPIGAPEKSRPGYGGVGSVAAAVRPHRRLDSRQAIAGTASSAGSGAAPAPGLPVPSRSAPGPTREAPSYVTVCRKLRALHGQCRGRSRLDLIRQIKIAQDSARRRVMDVFDDFKGNRSKLQQRSVDVGIGEQAYFHLRRLALKAEKDGDKVARDAILLRLAKCDRQSNDACRALYEKYDRTVEPSTAPLARPQVAAEPEVAGATKVSTDTEWGRLDWMARVRAIAENSRLLRGTAAVCRI